MRSAVPTRAATIVAALTLGALALGACSKQDSPTGPPAQTGTGIIGSGVTTPPTSADSPTAAPPPAPPSYPNDAAAYATAAVTAWAGRITARLDQLEVNAGTLHTLLACNGCYNTHFTLRGCDGAAGSTYCLFFNAVGDELRLRLDNTLIGKAHAVVTGSIWNPIAFPTDNQAYAQEALDAWQSGDDARLKLLTAASMSTAQVTALGLDRAGSWSFDHSEGAMGSTYYTWHDGGGHKISFRFSNSVGPAPTTGPQSQHRIVEIISGP